MCREVDLPEEESHKTFSSVPLKVVNRDYDKIPIIPPIRGVDNSLSDSETDGVISDQNEPFDSSDSDSTSSSESSK